MENADKVRALQQELAGEIERLVSSEDWIRALEVSARFHRYSFHNAMLILHQRPDATRVAGFHAWRELGRYVRKGERGIAILAPMVFRKRRDDGAEDDEAPETVTRFRVVHVFDISQTDGEDVPALPGPVALEGDAPEELYGRLAILANQRGYSVERGDPGGTAFGVTIPGSHRIIVRDDVSPLQATKTLAHELGHVTLGHCEGLGALACRGIGEVEAESVAFIVCRAAGLETVSYSAPYVATWAGGDVKTVKATGERVCRTARTILEALETAAAESAAA